MGNWEIFLFVSIPSLALSIFRSFSAILLQIKRKTCLYIDENTDWFFPQGMLFFHKSACFSHKNLNTSSSKRGPCLSIITVAAAVCVIPCVCVFFQGSSPPLLFKERKPKEAEKAPAMYSKRTPPAESPAKAAPSARPSPLTVSPLFYPIPSHSVRDGIWNRINC